MKILALAGGLSGPTYKTYGLYLRMIFIASLSHVHATHAAHALPQISPMTHTHHYRSRFAQGSGSLPSPPICSPARCLSLCLDAVLYLYTVPGWSPW